MEILTTNSQATLAKASARFRRRLLLLTILLLLAAALLARPVHADDREYQLKAAFLYNFAKYTEWPSASGPLVIGIVGKDPFGATIDKAVEGKNINGRAIEVKRMAFGPDMKSCAMVFISSSESGKVGKLAETLKGAPVLTVGESPGFASKGGIINFTLEDGKIHFEINPGAAKKAKLTISPKLLGLAKVVD